MASIDEIVKTTVDKAVAEKNVEFEKTLYKILREQLLTDLSVVRPMEIKIDGKVKKLPRQIRHEKTEIVLSYLAAKVPILLVGPAGSGKTHIAFDCADMLGLAAYSISVNEQTSKSDFLGYNDAGGKIVKTNFRKAYEEGGVFIIDEIDAGNPNILTVINSALSNDLCPFPDSMVKRHENFVCVCTANTFGEGESMQYIGRNILDAATKDRFASIFIDYSDMVEKSLIPQTYEFVRDLRKHFKGNGTLMVVSTRGAMRVEVMIQINKGVGTEDVVDCLNLHNEVKKDARLKDMVDKFVNKGKKTAEWGVDEMKVKILARHGSA